MKKTLLLMCSIIAVGTIVDAAMQEQHWQLRFIPADPALRIQTVGSYDYSIQECYKSVTHIIASDLKLAVGGRYDCIRTK